jgi:gas vesicle protein
MNLKSAGRWGLAAALGVVGTASAILLNPRTGPKSRRQVRKASSAVVRRERAHIAALAGAAHKRKASETE